MLFLRAFVSTKVSKATAYFRHHQVTLSSHFCIDKSAKNDHSFSAPLRSLSPTSHPTQNKLFCTAAAPHCQRRPTKRRKPWRLFFNLNVYSSTALCFSATNRHTLSSARRAVKIAERKSEAYSHECYDNAVTVLRFL